jgi:hypothetical protein
MKIRPYILCVLGLLAASAGRTASAGTVRTTALRPATARPTSDKPDKTQKKLPAAKKKLQQPDLSKRVASRNPDRATNPVEVVTSPHFRVHCANRELGDILAGQAELDLRRIRESLIVEKVDLPYIVDIHVWPDPQKYLAEAPHASTDSVGCASEVHTDDGPPTQRIDLLHRSDDNVFLTNLLQRVLPHEICHIVLREYMRQGRPQNSGDRANGDPCPLALHEGLAMLAENRTDEDRIRLAALAACANTETPLLQIQKLLSRQRYNQTTDDKKAIFYAASYSFAEFLRGRLNDEQFGEFLAHVRRGCSVPVAIQRAMYLPHNKKFPKELAKAWKQYAILQGQILQTLEQAGDAPAKKTPPQQPRRRKDKNDNNA